MPKRKRSLQISLWDAFLFSIMVGAGETYLPAYGLSIGMGEALSGLFAAVPLIGGAFIQLLTPWIVARVGSIQRWVAGAALLQALAFVPLIYLATVGTDNFLLLFVIAAVYWGAGFAASPSWNFWMGYLVPPEKATTFFATRARVAQLGVLLGIVGGGYALQFKVAVGPFTSVFSILFLVAFLSRATSSLILTWKVYDANWVYVPPSGTLRKTILSFWNHKPYRQFFGFLFCFTSVLFFSSPFVTPFFLAKLQLTYHEYMLALAVLFLAKILTLPFVDILVRKWGVRMVFFLGAIGISPLPAFWGVSHSLLFVLSIQALSGLFWGLYEVALTMVFFGQLRNDEKIPVLTLFNLFNSAAIIIGTLLGGKVLHGMGETLTAYSTLFIIGGCARVAVAVGYQYWTREEKTLLPFEEPSKSFPHKESFSLH